MSAEAGRLGRWNGRVTLWLARIAALVLAALAVVTFCDVIARYFLNAPFSFTVELTEIAMGILVYLGVGLTTHENDHISVDVVTLRLSDTWRAIMSLVTHALALLFLVFLVWRVWERAIVLLSKGDTTPILFLPLSPFAFIMAAGSVFFITGVLAHAADAARRLKKPETANPPPPGIARHWRE
jgi:TRAP-type C4-dicarboxylate transport system permease small subunit